MLFVIHAQDKTDSVELRKSTRDAHLSYLADFVTLVGGPILDAKGAMCGTCMILEAEDLDAAKSFAANDPYNQAGLFADVAVHEFKKVSWPT